MKDFFRLDSVSTAALWLISGRGAGFLVAFVVPLVVVRLFDQASFGTYKQLFLIYGTLFGVAQMGVAESLYYFVPRYPSAAGRYVSNAVITLTLIGVVCAVAIHGSADRIGQALTNPLLGNTLLPLGLFLGLMLASAPFEIVLVSRRQYKAAALTYAASDIGRAVCVLLPALALGGLRGLLWGAVVFAAARVAAMVWSFRRDLWPTLGSGPGVWRQQWAYTLPFAVAVGLEGVQANVHHYLVASRFDPATFAIYAVGCLQVPLVDVITGSSVNIMMVKMGDDGFDRQGPAALALLHDTARRIAFVILPLAAFLLVMARDVIVVLFTDSYLASVPIFMLWTLTMVFAIPCVDSVLRVHAQTRFLFGLNVLRLGVVAALTGVFLTWYGLSGAVLVMLLSTALARAAGLWRIATLLGVGLADVMPWPRLAATASHAAVAALPTYLFAYASSLPRPVVVACATAIYGVTYAALSYGFSGSSTSAAAAKALQGARP